MANVITVGKHEVEYSWIADRGTYRATVMVRSYKPVGDVRSVGYVFKTPHGTQAAALAEAKEKAEIAAKHPDHHIAGADGRFAAQQ